MAIGLAIGLAKGSLIENKGYLLWIIHSNINRYNHILTNGLSG